MQFHIGDADEHWGKEDVEMELPSMVRKTWLNTREVTDLVEGIIVLPKTYNSTMVLDKWLKY